MKQYEFDKKSMRYRIVGFNIWKPLGTILKVFLVSLTFFAILYSVLASFLSTDTERRLRNEIRAYEKSYDELQEREQLLGKSISALEVKDNNIYHVVFRNEAPSVDPMSSLNIFYGADTIPEAKIVTYTTEKTERLVRQAGMVEEAFRKIYRSLASSKNPLPPMELPVKDVSYPQLGASTGPRLNPILKAEVQHDGLDFIVPQGTPVYATADAVVESVARSSKGDGNTVTLRHDGDYYTRYCHLSDIKVKEGQSIKKGRVIGESGMSGDAFAPHLHYEVMLYGRIKDPVNYIFASVTPEEYSNMLYMSIYTKESMD